MKKICILTCILIQGLVLHAQDNYWKKVTTSSTDRNSLNSVAKLKAGAYQTYSLNESELRLRLAGAAEEQAKTVAAKIMIAVPVANGAFINFAVRQVAVMQPKLATKYPNIKAYIGHSADSNATIHFDVTPEGFHATIFLNGTTTYINPVNKVAKIYAVYQRDAVTAEHATFKCFAGDAINKVALTTRTSNTEGAYAKLRIYRLALVATGEYSTYFLDGTEKTTVEKTQKILSQLTTCIVRANAIFERDLGVRLVLVDKEDSIIFLNAATDPFRNEFNATTQTTCDTYIGNANYDIGHVVHRSADNGNAGCIGCICSAGSKGSAFTMYGNPDLIDPFVVDYLTHEIGHQLGANHTFTFSNEGTIANLEPGSGSTIMGYAGITGSTDVQQHSDDYFNAVSIQQITENLTGPAGCAVVRSTLNAIPVAATGASNYLIPQSTPFALTGNGSDANAKNVLTYCWEQFDLPGSGSNTFPQPNSVRGPLFRSVAPSTSSVRYFPNLNTILSGQLKNKWEALPAVARKLNFRLTVRDNKNATSISNLVTVTVSNNAGPFFVTFPDTLVRWHAGDSRVIKWDAGSTNTSDVNCQTVNILLSIDGGATFPYVLASKVPNKGKKAVVIPDVSSKNCRIKVEAADNIFFDISNNNFIINKAVASAVIQKQPGFLQPQILLFPNPATNVLNITVASNSSAVIYNAAGKIVNTKKLIAGTNIINIKTIAAGNYYVHIAAPGKANTTLSFIKE